MRSLSLRFLACWAAGIATESFLVTMLILAVAPSIIGHNSTPAPVPFRMQLVSTQVVTNSILPAPTGLHVTTSPYRGKATWNSVSGAAVYELRISGSGSSPGATHFDRVLSARSALVVLGAGGYYANVRAGISAHDVHGHWSTTVHFTVPRPTPVGTLAYRAMKEAITRIGAPYVWAAAGPWAFDCSGLVVWSYAQLGRYEPHFTGDLWVRGFHVSRSSLMPGDLVFMYSIGHVGIYIGNGRMVDAPRPGLSVRTEAVPWSSYDGAVRIT